MFRLPSALRSPFRVTNVNAAKLTHKFCPQGRDEFPPVDGVKAAKSSNQVLLLFPREDFPSFGNVKPAKPTVKAS